MIDEARLDDSGTAPSPAGQGWFVLNACDARRFESEDRRSLPLAYGDFPKSQPSLNRDGWLPQL
ncbi:MAG TPA: hypothetical protein VEH52_08780 [Gaiellaceae bacterium]|jgi:hypothetical protein|nr:hypothetical protein [Gaiellaceae bacterium]